MAKHLQEAFAFDIHIRCDVDEKFPAEGIKLVCDRHAVAIYGDTKPSDNMVRFSQGVDLLIHEVGQSKLDPACLD